MFSLRTVQYAFNIVHFIVKSKSETLIRRVLKATSSTQVQCVKNNGALAGDSTFCCFQLITWNGTEEFAVKKAIVSVLSMFIIVVSYSKHKINPGLKGLPEGISFLV